MSLPLPRARWRVFARRGLLLALGVGALSALVEHFLELRDVARLTANETFYTAHGRRIRYHQTGPSTPGPTLVLLNGIWASLEQWGSIQAALSTVSPVVSYDRSGVGFSDPTDAYDAEAEADELELLLHSPKISGPFVLVGFSSSSMMAIVFAARHPDVVKGIVFIDPIVGTPGPGGRTHRRNFWRTSVMSPVNAFFGYTRLKLAVEARNAPPSSPASERSYAILASTHHWFASAREVMSLDRSAHEADAAMATRPFAGIPLGMLLSDDFHDLLERQKKLAASSEQGIIRAIHCKHSQIPTDPDAVAAVVDMVRTIADEARAKAPDKAPDKAPAIVNSLDGQR
jgi:pimeloyl-ACP methyl ester carboxylesterase